MKNVSQLVDVEWVWGLQLVQLGDANTPLMAQHVEQVLGPTLYTLQIGSFPLALCREDNNTSRITEKVTNLISMDHTGNDLSTIRFQTI
jgi:hypothetical protein